MTDDAKRALIDRRQLPSMWPTQAHDSHFWEQLGRTVATYGFLEQILGKAIFAFTATRQYSPEEAYAAYQAWLPKLERALTDPLRNLAEAYGKATRDNAATTTETVGELVEQIKSAAEIRNVLCHGSWGPPNADGVSVPFFVNRQMEVFQTPVDVAFLQQVQAHVAELACSVIDTVTHMGWQFPGETGPGEPIWPSS